MFKAAIRVNRFSTIAQLRGASLHAQRHDETGKALREVKEATGERNEYSALQTSWADWCRENLDGENLDRDIVRGTARKSRSASTCRRKPMGGGGVMDKARESVRAPSQGLWEAIRAPTCQSATQRP